LLNKLPTSSIDPLLRAPVLAVQHIGNVLLTEVQPPLPLDQRFDIIGNRHSPSLNEWWDGGESCGEERCQRPRRSQQRYSVLLAKQLRDVRRNAPGFLAHHCLSRRAFMPPVDHRSS
jgi:hypothetical protein